MNIAKTLARLVLVPGLLLTAALAQGTPPSTPSPTSAAATVSPEAAALLEKARIAHGGLEVLRTYRDQTLLSLYGPNGQVAAEVRGVTLLDLAGERVRIEVGVGDRLAQVQQYTAQAAFSWTPQVGVLRLPASEARLLRDVLGQGVWGLRLGGGGREAASLDGEKSFLGLTGQALSVVTRGARTTYLLGPDGQVLAERFTSSQLGEVTTLYSDYREVGGLKLPFASTVYAGETLFAATKVLNLMVNPTFADVDFQQPR